MPYWRLSNFYLFYFASLGALVPYWSLYLKDLGFSALEIGQLMGLLMATKIVSPNIWSWIADHTGYRMGIVRWGAALALLTFAAVFWATEYWPLALVMFLFSFFWNAVLPQFEANTLKHLGEESHRYASVRLWGSIGFIVTVAVLGPLLGLFGAGILPGVLLLLFAAIWLSSLWVPEQGEPVIESGENNLWQLLRQPQVLALMAVCFLMLASHGPYYTFYTLYMEGFGYSRAVIGQLWALGVIAEVGVFLVMSRLVLRFGLRRLLLVSFLLATLRWLLTGLFPEQIVIVLFSQSLHAATFGLFHAVVIALFHRHFTGRHHGRGQALYSSLSFGAGGAVGAFYAGWSWEGLGGANTFYIAALLSAVALAIGWRWIERDSP